MTKRRFHQLQSLLYSSIGTTSEVSWSKAIQSAKFYELPSRKDIGRWNDEEREILKRLIMEDLVERPEADRGGMK